MSIKVYLLNVEHYIISILKDVGIEGFDFVMETECYNPMKFLRRFGVLHALFSRLLLAKQLYISCLRTVICFAWVYFLFLQNEALCNLVNWLAKKGHNAISNLHLLKESN